MSKNIRPTRPTRRQKAIISGLGLNAEQYLVVFENEEIIRLYNKPTGKIIPRHKKGAGK